MNEADTRATLIEPKLRLAGGTDRLVTREYYYQRDHQFAPGRIILIGDQVRRGTSRRIDYLLRLTEGLPIAVVEAKADTESVEAGLEQAKRYAQELSLMFAYAANGRHIIEYDFSVHASRSLPNFPSPQELWARWSRSLQGTTAAEDLKAAEAPPNYGHFCAEEPQVAVDPTHPEHGSWRPPAYQYSLGQGIEDGFLATYKVHRVRTTVDVRGLALHDAEEVQQGKSHSG